MKCQSLFLGKNEKNIINLSSAEFAQIEVKVNSMEFCVHLSVIRCKHKSVICI